MTEQATSRRLTVQEAAEVLGTTVDAVRMRARRGSLDSEKEPDGRVYVYLNVDSSETKHRPNGDPDALILAKDETIALLREQISEEREARRRADTIIAQLTQTNTQLSSRVLELDAPADPSAPPQRNETAAQDSANGSPDPVPQAHGGEARNDTQRPWWRRMFGGEEGRG